MVGLSSDFASLYLPVSISAPYLDCERGYQFVCAAEGVGVRALLRHRLAAGGGVFISYLAICE